MQRPNRRRREHDVTDLAQPNQQNLQSITARWLLHRSALRGCRL
jgi:hypothetical protein